MQRFFSVGFATLVAIAMTFGTVARITAEAAPLKKPVAIDKTLLTDEFSSQKSKAEIHAASRNYLTALQQGDGKAIAAFWTAHGIYVDSSGQSHLARTLIGQEFTHSGSDQKRATDGNENRRLPKPGTIHWVAHNVALERGTALQGAGSTVELDYLAVWVYRNNRWLLDYIQESTRLAETSGQHHSNLSQLEWMVGQWSTQGAGPVAQLTVTWSDDKKYLMQKFKVQLPGQKELHGEQRIAWDPVGKTIRSWIFRADGGFAESKWTREGDTWVVTTQGVDASGAKTSAVNLWAADGPDQCWFKSVRLSQDKSSTDGEKQDEVLLQFRRIDGDR